MSTSVNVAVIGAGIIGVSSALCIAQSLPSIKVTIISDKFTPDTTGDTAAGFWMPYLLGNEGIKDQMIWAEETFKFIHDLYKTEIASEIGINLISGFKLSYEPEHEEKSFWKDIVFGFRKMTKAELTLFNSPPHGEALTTFTTECVKFLPFLMKRFESLGGRFLKKTVREFKELSTDYDIVVNCCGVRAKNLTQDQKIHPIRGQVVRVYAPWVKHFIISEKHYIIPNSDCVILGGTHQENDWNLNSDPRDEDYILKGCYELIPSLKNAKKIKTGIGLRPGRASIRLEREEIIYDYNKLQVVHNYGHGGSGVTLFWGCAQRTAELVKDILNYSSKKATNRYSKL